MAFDASASTINGASLGSTDVNITVGSGADRHLIVGVFLTRTASETPSVSSDVDGAFSAITDGAWTADPRPGVYTFELDAPSTGAHVITATLPTESRITGVIAVSENEVASVRGANSGGGFDSSYSVDVTTVAADVVLDFLAIAADSGDSLPTDDETNVLEQGTSGINQQIQASREIATGTTTTASWTRGADSDSYGMVALALEPTGGGATTGATHKLAGRGGGLVGPGGLAGKGGGLVARSMEQINGIWRPRLWPVGLDLQGA